MLLLANVVMVPREEKNNLDRVWTQEEDICRRSSLVTKQRAYVSRDVILVESLPQRLGEPFRYIELQGFTDVRSPLGQKENCGAKQKCGNQDKAADLLINEPPLLPSQHLLQALSEAGECRFRREGCRSVSPDEGKKALGIWAALVDRQLPRGWHFISDQCYLRL